MTGARDDEGMDRQADHPCARSHQLHEGDIRLLAGLEEVVFTIRQGADDLERWGRCAELDRIEKVRRLAALAGAINQRLNAEVAAAVAALADVKDLQVCRCALGAARTEGRSIDARQPEQAFTPSSLGTLAGSGQPVT